MRGEPTCRVTSPFGEDVTVSDSAGEREKVEVIGEQLSVITTVQLQGQTKDIFSAGERSWLLMSIVSLMV